MNETIKINVLAGLALCGTMTASAANAQAQLPTSDALIAELKRCRSIAAADERLSCLDRASAALDAAIDAKRVRIVDRKDVREAKRALFGFAVPKIRLFGDREEADEPEFTELNTTITSARVVENGRVELRLAEGDATWMTTDPMPFPPKAGAKVRVRKGALGNYFISIQGERSVRGMRVR